jgi:hypothetical protein
MLHSDYRELTAVQLPYKGRQMYMHTFDLADPVMAFGYEDYTDVVMGLCEAAGATIGLAHMTVDEKIVKAGMSQRRPKPHVDGCFQPTELKWGGGWNHYCNSLAGMPFRRMPVIIASSAAGAIAWRGEFDAEPTSEGDLSHLALSVGEVLTPGVGYLLSPDCVHESMLQPEDVQRTFLRIALPVEFDYAAKRG